MKLSAEQFAELAASFDARQSSSQHERRRAARLDLQARIRIRPMAGSRQLGPMSITVANFSARGLSLVHDMPMEAGRQFVTELPRKGGGFVELLCVVVHCRPIGADAYRVGAEFVCVAPASHTAPGDSDERKRISKSMLG